MKRMFLPVIGILAVSAFLLFVLAQARAGEKQECSLASLHGTYGFTSTGFRVDTGPVANVGIFTFDGQGSLTQDLTNSRNGVISRGVHAKGTYTVSSNCRGSWEIVSSTSPTADFAINTREHEVMFIRTDEGSTITGILRKQAL